MSGKTSIRQTALLDSVAAIFKPATLTLILSITLGCGPKPRDMRVAYVSIPGGATVTVGQGGFDLDLVEGNWDLGELQTCQTAQRGAKENSQRVEDVLVCGMYTRFLWGTLDWKPSEYRHWKWPKEFQNYYAEQTKIMPVTFKGTGKPDIGEKSNTNIGSAYWTCKRTVDGISCD